MLKSNWNFRPKVRRVSEIYIIFLIIERKGLIKGPHFIPSVWFFDNAWGFQGGPLDWVTIVPRGWCLSVIYSFDRGRNFSRVVAKKWIPFLVKLNGIWSQCQFFICFWIKLNPVGYENKWKLVNTVLFDKKPKAFFHSSFSLNSK